MKLSLVGLALLLACLPLSAQEQPDPWDLVPGHWQFTHGDPVLGALALGGTVANLAPLFLPSVTGGPTEYWVEKGGEHYFAWSDPALASTDELRPLRAGVGVAGIWGGFFSVYADWDRAVKTDPTGQWVAFRGLGMADYLTAPFQPDFVFNFDVFPMFPLLELAPITAADWKAMGSFFQRDRVDFLGTRVSPAAGLALTAAGAVVLVSANAALEEIEFRGMLQSQWGVVGSAAFFGANHLLNPFALPNFSFEQAGQQALFATLFGLYAGSRTEANDGDFRRMIALHFWHNVTSLVVGYLVDPEQAQLFQLSFSL